MQQLSNKGVENHFIAKINLREQLIKKVQIIPLEVIIRNIAAGSICKRVGVAEGEKILAPIFEISYKNDQLGDPLINNDHAVNLLKIVTKPQIENIERLALKINQILQVFFAKINLELIDFKIEFGFDQSQNIILADEISPDSCRLWDLSTKQKMDKDVFRRNLGNLVEIYQEVANRLNV